MKKSKRIVFMALMAVICVAAISYGVYLGENKIIYKKASVICAECIGLG